MSSFQLRRSFLALAATVIFLAGCGAGIWRFFNARDAILADLVSDARRCAIGFQPSELAQLSGTRTDLNLPVYREIKDRLRQLRSVDPDVRFVYIFRSQPTGAVIFLADSEAADSKEVSLPGDEYPEVRSSPGLQSILANGKPATEGPLQDEFGSWVTGYAPIGPPTDHPTHILGLDISAEHWWRTLLTAAFSTAGYVWMLLLLPLASFVTTQRQVQSRDALRNLTEAMEQGHSAVMIVDLDRRIEYINAEFCRQTGYARRELIGREWREFSGLEAPPELLADLITTVRLGHSWTGEWTMRRKDGSPFPVRGGITPVKDRTGKIRSFVGVFDDMTEVRRTEAVLREAKERAEAGDRAKGQFLATMSHEIRTPLNGIVGFASLLLETPLSPEQKEYVETVRSSSETLIQLTGDILDYARIESGRLKLEPQPCDPRECVENALDLAAAPAARKNIELLHWIDDSVPTSVVVDVNRLRQILVNLVSNAVKFTPEGEVEVRVRSLTRDGSAGEPNAQCVLEFSVRDTGIGIAATHYNKIFRPFSQADESTTRRFGGTGLGLAICKNLVELMGGTISFTSELGKGSTFTFTVRVERNLESEPTPALPKLDQRVALAVSSPGLRTELARLVTAWGGQVVETDLSALRATNDWDLAIVDVTPSLAIELATTSDSAVWPAEKVIGLMPWLLSGELRTALRHRFRAVMNKPIHHPMLQHLLVGSRPRPVNPAPSPESNASHFDLCVMIVEDNPVNQKFIQRVVAKLGCQWLAVANGRLALDELSRTRPDLILMDLHMPELDGLMATMKIRAGEAGEAVRNIWIIALTADAREDQRERTLAAGANDYLTKPVRLPELTAALERFVRERKS